MAIGWVAGLVATVGGSDGWVVGLVFTYKGGHAWAGSGRFAPRS